MATYTVNTAKHATLTANVVDTVTTSTPRFGQEIEVTNRGATEIYFRSDGATPTVGGDDCMVVLPGGALKVDRVSDDHTPTTVKLISSAAVAYSVTSG